MCGVLGKDWSTEGRGPRTAMDAVLELRGELAAGREREGRGLGKVEEGVEMLTVGPIDRRWSGDGNRRAAVVLVQEQSRGKIGEEAVASGEAGRLGELGMAMESYRRCLL